MRVISGSARGRKLFSPDGMDVRPTTDKVKESLFNIIQFMLPDSIVLDLFAGSGQLGIEALSRGASETVFVDSSKNSLDIVKKNIELTGFVKSAKTIYSDAFAYLSRCTQTFDIVFLDPPYEKKLCDRVFELLPAVLNKNSVVICETRSTETLPERVGELIIYKEYIYSAIKLSVYKTAEVEE